ncbi:MAG: hypothetical protein WD491_00320 [Balneolales bacterium]
MHPVGQRPEDKFGTGETPVPAPLCIHMPIPKHLHANTNASYAGTNAFVRRYRWIYKGL